MTGNLRVINSEGVDIGPNLETAAGRSGCPIRLLLACVLAESGRTSPNPYAERWGSETQAAKDAIRAGDWNTVRGILARAGADVSFGYGQQILLYHYFGDKTSSLENAMAVRERVFTNPQENLNDCAVRLVSNLNRVQAVDLQPVAGDRHLAALVVYNAGHYPEYPSPWWESWAGNVESYRQCLALADKAIK